MGPCHGRLEDRVVLPTHPRLGRRPGLLRRGGPAPWKGERAPEEGHGHEALALGRVHRALDVEGRLHRLGCRGEPRHAPGKALAGTPLSCRRGLRTTGCRGIRDLSTAHRSAHLPRPPGADRTATASVARGTERSRNTLPVPAHRRVSGHRPPPGRSAFPAGFGTGRSPPGAR